MLQHHVMNEVEMDEHAILRKYGVWELNIPHVIASSRVEKSLNLQTRDLMFEPS